jgi:tetratricopeptide (TPR) repeat protein
MSKAYKCILPLFGVLVLVSCQSHKPPKMALEPGTPAFEQVYQEGRTAYEAGRFDEAAEKFARVVRADPEHFKALVNWGVALSRGGKPSQAILKFQQALAQDPDNLNNAEAYHNWGVALERLGNHQEAVKKFDQAVTLKAELLTPALQRYLLRHRPQQQEIQIESLPPPPPPPQ